MRIASAALLFPFTVAILWFGSPYSDILVTVITIILLGEWARLCWQAKFTDVTKLVWLALGAAYILLCCLSFWQIGNVFGATGQIYLLVLGSVNDISAYAIGSWLKGPKLAPKITPNKTWAGSIGGILGVMLLGIGEYYRGPYSDDPYDIMLPFLTILFMFLSIVAQLGDLLESWAKRRFGVKDSSNLIPGHGGMLDRVDSLLAISLLVGYFIFFL